jgi:prepilin-type N-terminal cleavage/methylation domain-containing protein
VNKRAGITLIEMVVTMTIVVILSAGLTRAFVIGVNYETNLAAARERQEAQDKTDDRLTELFQRAYLSPDNTNTDTFFIGGTVEDSGIGSSTADTVQFTISGGRPSSALLDSTDDFETLNQRYGPQGGVAEVSLSMTAVGDAGANTGLFLRTQRPSDSEPTQGGTEEVFDADITSISFEFWDGQAWQTSWSTQVGATKRLPAAVRITYSRTGEDDNSSHILVVRLPISDVTANNPADQTAPGGAQ